MSLRRQLDPTLFLLFIHSNMRMFSLLFNCWINMLVGISIQFKTILEDNMIGIMNFLVIINAYTKYILNTYIF